MNIRGVRRLVNDMGLVGDVCPVNKHVQVRSDELDREYVTLLVVTPEGYVKEDDGILPTDGSVVAKTPEELRTWLDEKTGGTVD